jgi:hypothetical protein
LNHRREQERRRQTNCFEVVWDHRRRTDWVLLQERHYCFQTNQLTVVQLLLQVRRRRTSQFPQALLENILIHDAYRRERQQTSRGSASE